MRYLKELKKEASSGKAQIKAPARTMKDVKKQVLGYETKGDAAYYPMPPLTLTSILSATKLPSTKPSHELVMLPDAKVSPTLGIGLGGLQMRMRVKRETEGVPKNSIVGMGLKNQSATGGAADISLKPKTAAPIDVLISKLKEPGTQKMIQQYALPAAGGVAGGAVGYASGPEEGRGFRTLVGGALGAAGGDKLKKYLDQNKTVGQQMGSKLDDVLSKAKAYGERARGGPPTK